MQTRSQKSDLNTAEELRKGLAYHQSAQPEEAQAAYRKILQVDPMHPDALHLWGVLAFEGGHLEKAESLIAKAIQADPTRPEFYNNMGNVCYQKGNLSKAASNYEKAITLKPDYAAAFINLGNTKQQLQLYQEAILNYSQALKIEPEIAPAWFNLAKAYRAENNLDRALEALDEVIRLKPDYVAAYDELGSIYDKLSDPSKAAFYYEKFLELKPDSWTTCFNLGNLYRQQNDIQQAIRHYRRALRLNPHFDMAYLNLGIAHKSAGNLNEAEQCYCRCIELNPNLAEAYYNLGNLYYEIGQYKLAVQQYRQSLEIKPEMIEVLNNLAQIYEQQGELDAAIECLNKSLQIDSQHPETFHNAGMVLLKIGRPKDSIGFFKRVLEIKPELNSAIIGTGSALLEMDRIDEADACYRQALKGDPNNSAIFFNLGVTSQIRGEYQQSKQYFEQALILAPDLNSAKWQSQLMLPVLYANPEEISKYRQIFEKSLDDLIRNTELTTSRQCKQALAGISTKTNFHLPYQGRNDVELQKKFGNFAVRIMSANYPQWSLIRRMPSLKRNSRIRIGFVSSYLYSHTVGMFLKGWVKHLDRRKFEIYGYQIHNKSDELTEEFKELFEYYYQVANNLEAAAGQIISDDLHILVFTDIGMNPLSFQLAALRLAPVQCKGWGHPVTTGLPTMDYYLSSDLMEPQNAQSHYSEKLIRLPNLALRYQKPSTPANPAERQFFGIEVNRFVYLSPQSLFKYLPQYDEIYPRIAREIKDAQFIFISHQSESVTQKFKIRLCKAFNRYDLDFETFCQIMPRLGFNDYMNLNLCSNVLLDTPAWSGGKTSLEGLASGLPVVTLPGKFLRGRHAYAMLKMMGLNETIANDIDHYVDLAVRLGIDPEFYQKIRSAVISRHHRLFDDDSVTRTLESFFTKTVKEALTRDGSKRF